MLSIYIPEIELQPHNMHKSIANSEEGLVLLSFPSHIEYLLTVFAKIVMLPEMQMGLVVVGLPQLLPLAFCCLYQYNDQNIAM